MELNKDILRWVLLIGATPIWLPFLRMLWRDFNKALREDGGLLGAPMSAKELEDLRAERQVEPESLTSEPWVRGNEHRAPRLKTPTSRPRATLPSSAKPGFRSSGPARRRGR